MAWDADKASSYEFVVEPPDQADGDYSLQGANWSESYILLAAISLPISFRNEFGIS